MSEGKKRRTHSADFKAKIGLEAVRGVKTINEIAQEHNMHPQLVTQWKKEILENASALFDTKRGPKPVGVPRATVYRRLGAMVRQQHEDQEDNDLRALIYQDYNNRPFYGSRRMTVFLRGRGPKVNRKRVQRLMREMGLAGMAPGPAMSKPHPQH